MVADDEETVRSIAAEILEEVGFRILLAKDGGEAVALFRQHTGQLVLILLDVTMPVMNGDEVYAEIRRVREDVPVVLTSGYTESDAAGRFAEHPPSGFIQKPFLPEALIAKVREALGHKAND